MSDQVHIRCSHCGTFNVDKEYCDQCNQLLSVVQQRQEKRLEQEKEQWQAEISKPPSKFEAFLKSLLEHRFLVIRVLARVLTAIWMIVMAVGGAIAWLIAMIAA